MMGHVLEVIDESGVFKPLEAIELPEHQRVILSIEVLSVEAPETALETWQRVSSGLSDQDIAEIESIARDRSGFMAQKG